MKHNKVVGIILLVFSLILALLQIALMNDGVGQLYEQSRYLCLNFTAKDVYKNEVNKTQMASLPTSAVMRKWLRLLLLGTTCLGWGNSGIAAE
mmetsp:Transcript_13664/g.21405  ORF Transcript_13664/g.21405 Transcript_13664/m.21405 type:complete len:93 (-) Transcript_13664:16-294(-)